ncbi:MAG: hypothetical protein F4X11_21730 [Acidobacteria bacterium]|nr:hypothetical protein [Chloroflexota bacterium]MYN67614.1 hypothetical protein [Acidobacteriota bacterium]
MTAENELAVGFLWAVAYMFLLVGVFGFGACWLLKDTVRWVLREPHLRWHRAGRLVAGIATVGGLGTMSAFLGDNWTLAFVIVCALSTLFVKYGASALKRLGVL